MGLLQYRIIVYYQLCNINCTNSKVYIICLSYTMLHAPLATYQPLLTPRRHLYRAIRQHQATNPTRRKAAFNPPSISTSMSVSVTSLRRPHTSIQLRCCLALLFTHSCSCGPGLACGGGPPEPRRAERLAARPPFWQPILSYQAVSQEMEKLGPKLSSFGGRLVPRLRRGPLSRSPYRTSSHQGPHQHGQ